MASFLLLLLCCAGLSAAADRRLHSAQVKVAQCRAQCLDKFTWPGWTPSDALCQETPDCFMCWESCDLLNQNFVVWGTMCSRKDICFPGCQQACGFYVQGSIAHESAAAASSSDATLRFQKPIEFRESSISGLTLTWTKPQVQVSHPPSAGHQDNVVYAVLRRTRIVGDDTTWQPVIQTSELSTSLEASTLPPSATLDFKVIAVTGTRMSGQVVTSHRVTSAVTMPQDGNKNNKSPSLLLPPPSSWTLRLMALTHNAHLGSVDAVVTWASPGLTGNFLVTWEAKEGTFAITGHLYTDSTTVSLTLWPDTIYSVQVELVTATRDTKPAMRSEPLAIDTTVVSRSSVRSRDETTGRECSSNTLVVVISVTIAVSVVLLVAVISLTVNCRRGHHHSRRPTSSCPLDVEFNNNSSKKSEAIRRKLSAISINPIDVESGVLTPNASSDASSSLDERLSAFRAFLENVEKMATDSLGPKATPLPSDTSKLRNSSSNDVLFDEDGGSTFEPATEKLIKKNTKRSMSTAM